MKDELMTTLPQDPIKRQSVKNAIDCLNNNRLQKSSLSDNDKDIIKTQKENNHMCPKYLRKMAKLAWDRQFGDGKVAIEYEHASQIIDDIDELYN